MKLDNEIIKDEYENVKERYVVLIFGEKEKQEAQFIIDEIYNNTGIKFDYYGIEYAVSYENIFKFEENKEAYRYAEMKYKYKFKIKGVKTMSLYKQKHDMKGMIHKVCKVGKVEAPWCICYVYKDLYGSYFFDLDDDGTMIEKSGAKDIDEAIQDLKDYLICVCEDNIDSCKEEIENCKDEDEIEDIKKEIVENKKWIEDITK